MLERLKRQRRMMGLIAAALVIGSFASPAGGAPSAGFLTQAEPMLLAVDPDVEMTPIITVGEDLAGGYQFEAIPDGIAIAPTRGGGRVDVYVNHETSTVPFPYPASPTAATAQNDFDNAQLSHLVLSQSTGAVLHASMAIESSANYQRFCSNFLATEAEGFDRELLFTNEEAVDFVSRSGQAWPVSPATEPPNEQAGVTVAYDPQTHQYRTIYGMGRFNHENTVAIPGYEGIVTLSGDDTFVSNPPNSQVYMYTADDADAVWNDQGELWAFKSNNGAVDDYYDMPGIASTVSGVFIPVPDAVADGPQGGLESWSQSNGVFDFVRIEDIAYDRSDPNVVYLADSGRGSGAAPNGRIWRMELNPNDPTVVDELSILINGDPLGLKHPDAIHQPDNLETTENSLLITEDPSSGNQYDLGEANATTARIWRYDFGDEAKEIVLKVDEKDDPSFGVAPPFKLGNWEASGIVDASAAFGEGYFLVDVQAHSLWVETALGPDLVAPDGADWIYKREGGQLLLVYIPGA